MELLLKRLRSHAPRALPIFVNTLSLAEGCGGSRCDLVRVISDSGSAESCYHALARRHGLASLSWRRAVSPLLASGVLNTTDVLEVPMYHHPNTEGHRHLAAMLACLLDRALLETRDRLLVRPRPLPMDAVEATGSASGTRRVTQTRPTFASLLAEASANQLSHAKLRAFMRNRSGSSLTSSSSPTSTFPSCKFVGMPPLLLSKNRTAADGWWRRNHGLLAASKPNATLHLPFSCSSPGCGLTVALTQSYQPLGLLDLYVDGVPVGSKVSAANPMWARSRHPVWTVQSLHVAVSPRRPGASKGGLDRGLHTLLIVARGQTLPMVESLNLSTNYERHEVHVRGFIVMPGAESEP